MSDSFLQRNFKTKSLVAILLLLTMFFAYPTFIYNTILILLNSYESSSGTQVYIFFRYAVYIAGFIAGILLIGSLARNAENNEKTENLAAINFALQAFTTQAAIALGMHSSALRTYRPVPPGGGHFALIELTNLFLLIVSLILIAASLTLAFHHKLGNKLGQLAGTITFIGHAGAVIGTRVLSYYMSLDFGTGLSIVLAATSLLALYYLRKPYTATHEINS